MGSPRPLPSEVCALLDCERELSPLPATVRARSLARARAALVAGVDRRAILVAPRRARRAAVAAMACILGAAVGAAAYEIRVQLAAPAAPSRAPAVAPAATIETARTGTPPRAQALSTSSAPIVEERRATPAVSHASAGYAELRLLREARAAVAREDCVAALRPIAEHARRFREGRLSEEREALRVKALVGCGRTGDARRAAAAFRARFPRSVLLPAVSQMPAGES